MKDLCTISSLSSTDNTTGVSTLTTTGESNVKVLGQAVVTESDEYTITGCTQGSYAQTAPVTTSIKSTSNKVKVNGKKPLLDGDESLPVDVTLVDPSIPASIVIQVVVSVTAGQTKVKGA